MLGPSSCSIYTSGPCQWHIYQSPHNVHSDKIVSEDHVYHSSWSNEVTLPVNYMWSYEYMFFTPQKNVFGGIRKLCFLLFFLFLTCQSFFNFFLLII